MKDFITVLFAEYTICIIPDILSWINKERDSRRNPVYINIPLNHFPTSSDDSTPRLSPLIGKFYLL